MTKGFEYKNPYLLHKPQAHLLYDPCHVDHKYLIAFQIQRETAFPFGESETELYTLKKKLRLVP